MHAAALAAIKVLFGGMRLAESAARRARDHAIDEGGLPARFTTPCWRNNIAVVDNDARVSRAQALSNLSGTRGAPHGMLVPRVRVGGCARCAHGTTGKRNSLSQFLKNLKKISLVIFSEHTPRNAFL